MKFENKLLRFRLNPIIPITMIPAVFVLIIEIVFLCGYFNTYYLLIPLMCILISLCFLRAYEKYLEEMAETEKRNEVLNSIINNKVAGKLTNEQYNKIREKFLELLEDKVCVICNNKQFMLAREISQINTIDTTTLLRQPTVSLICGKCGHIDLFNVLVCGIVDKDLNFLL